LDGAASLDVCFDFQSIQERVPQPELSSGGALAQKLDSLIARRLSAHFEEVGPEFLELVGKWCSFGVGFEL